MYKTLSKTSVVENPLFLVENTIVALTGIALATTTEAKLFRTSLMTIDERTVNIPAIYTLDC